VSHRESAVIRLILAPICWGVCWLDWNDFLVYHPSGRGYTNAEMIWHIILIPGALLFGLFFAISGAVYLELHSKIASRRRAVGQCIHCGYDLRATPDRCPECGGVPKDDAMI
jgi:hypothetical protein